MNYLEEMMEKILDSACEIRIEYNGNEDDEPWIAALNGAHDWYEDADEMFMGETIFDAVEKAYEHIRGNL